MRHLYRIKLIVLLSVTVIQAGIEFPADDFVDGWKRTESPRYSANNLYGYINGGAELFLEFGFEELVIQRYQKVESEIAAEVYVMSEPRAALGVYLQKCGKENSNPDIAARNSSSLYQIMAVKNRYFILINNFEGAESNAAAMRHLANDVISTIADAELTDLWQILPEANKIPGSEMLLRGPYALQPIYTFGEGDILQLQAKIFAFFADYRSQLGDRFSRLYIPYPDKKYARDCYNNLLQNLDPYLEIVHSEETRFIFKDYNNDFGDVRLNGHVVEIKFKMKQWE